MSYFAQTILVSLGVAAASSALSSEGATLIGEYGAWSAYKQDSDAAELCFATSIPSRREPVELRRGEGYMFVSYRKSEGINDELSLVLGYPLQVSADASLTVGPDSFALMEKGEAAWLENADQQSRVINAFRRGRLAAVATTSARGNETSDEYSLLGFSQAYAAMKKACK